VRSIRVRTPAKINLFLRVLGLRPDGYHDIETLFQAIELYDELEIGESAKSTRLEVPGYPELETEENLVLQAHRWLERQTKRNLPCRIILKKRIPIAAGLGGGSSNAAAALLGIRAVFELDLSDENLHVAARSLGADVAFFLTGGTALGEGIGDQLSEIAVSTDYGLILANPGFSVSTRVIYAEFDRTLTMGRAHDSLTEVLRESVRAEDLLYNDLQPVAMALHPEIEEIAEELERAGARKALMSGSGPTVFGIADADPDQLRQIRDALPGAWNPVQSRPSSQGILID
jgi:4-diphosphocytidyl-2-C-methyl-D-erythritol kinase